MNETETDPCVEPDPPAGWESWQQFLHTMAETSQAMVSHLADTMVPVIDATIAAGGQFVALELEAKARRQPPGRKRNRTLRQLVQNRASVTQARQRIADRERKRLSTEALQKLKDDYLELETTHKYYFKERP